MRERRFRPIVCTLLPIAGFLALAASGVSAQESVRHRDRALAATIFEPSAAEAPTRVQQAGEKSPVLAGLLSWFIPGLGSYYARNSGHGTRHLVIWGVSGAVFFWGFVATVEDTIDDIISDENDVHPAFWVGLTALAVNGVWAVVTAVSDATDYNETLSIGPVEFAPAVVAARSPSPLTFDALPRDDRRVNIRLARLTF